MDTKAGFIEAMIPRRKTVVKSLVNYWTKRPDAAQEGTRGGNQRAHLAAYSLQKLIPFFIRACHALRALFGSFARSLSSFIFKLVKNRETDDHLRNVSISGGFVH